MGQAKVLLRSIQGLTEVDVRKRGYVIFSVKYGRPEVEEKGR